MSSATDRGRLSTTRKVLIFALILVAVVTVIGVIVGVTRGDGVEPNFGPDEASPAPTSSS